MRVLEINLATRPFRNNTLYWAGFGSAALILLVLTTVNLWLFFRSGTSVHQSEQELVLKQQKRQGLSRDEQRLSVKLTKLDFNGLRQEAEFANDAIRRRVFSWTELFNRLEEVVPPAVMMTALRPEIQAEGISIVAEGIAKDQEGLLDFEEGLIRSTYFARIYPGSERREQRGGELHFSLKFDYLPAGHPGVPAAPEKKAGKPAQEEAKESSPPTPGSRPATKTPQRPSPQAVAGTAPGEGSTASRLPASGGAIPPPVAQALPAPAAAQTGGTPSPQAAPKGSTGPARAPSPAPGAHARFTPGSKRGGPPGRPMLHPGMGVAVRVGAGPAEDTEARKNEAEAMAAANFVDKPLETVVAYLMKNRSMTFIFDGSFDLKQKVTMDVYDKEQWEIAQLLAEKLAAAVNLESENTWRFSPPKPPETLEEPSVDEEPVPDDSSADPPPKDDGPSGSRGGPC